MAAQLSKADQIRKLMHLSNAEIAKSVGVRPDYVRAVRQRTSASGNPTTAQCDRNWRGSEYGHAHYNAYMRDYMREYRRKRRAEARA